MSEFQGYTSVRPSLLRYACTVVPYECHVFADTRGKKLVVRRSEIAFFSHCWDLPRDQVGWWGARLGTVGLGLEAHQDAEAGEGLGERGRGDGGGHRSDPHM